MATPVPAVRVDGVSKSFVLPKERVHTLKERVLHPLRRTTSEELRALQDVSFEVQPGEFFAIVGRNGSGKSTLLKCMAGIYATDQGRIYVDGRMSTFIELGVGFNPDLPARDNVILNATMLGLSPRQARRRFDEVLDFAELHDFVDLKLKNYSSGMLVRLAFSVMIQVDAQVLLIDEVLAVGDAAFQQKCYDQFQAMRDRNATVLLVTHDMSAAQRFCDRAMLLEQGRQLETGETEHVANRYLEVNFGRQRSEETATADDAVDRWGDGRARILEAWFEDEHGARTDVLPTGRPCSYVMRTSFAEGVVNPVFSLTLEYPGQIIVATPHEGIREPLGAFAAGEEVTVRFGFDNVLTPERYHVTPAIADGFGQHWIDRPIRMQSLTVTGARMTSGILELPYTVDLQRTDASAREERVG